MLKKLTFDTPPEKILGIIAQVSEAADNTLEELGRYRELPPRIDRLAHAACQVVIEGDSCRKR